MTRRGLVLLTLAVILGVACGHALPDNSEDLAVTLVGNAGFILEQKGVRVGIDALFTVQIPTETRAMMEQAASPFDLNSILVTHDHSDHVHAQTVARNLQSQPDARLIAPESVIAAVRAAAPDLESHRLIAWHFEEQVPYVWEADGLRVEAFSFPHPPDGQPPNAGFRVHLGPFTVYHTGDLNVDTAREEFARFGFPEVPVDLAFVPYFQLSPPYANALEYLPSRFFVPMHIRAGRWAETCATLSESTPNLLGFDAPLEVRRIPAP